MNKKYSVTFGTGTEFTCDVYNVHNNCVEFLNCNDDNSIKIIPLDKMVINIKPLNTIREFKECGKRSGIKNVGVIIKDEQILLGDFLDNVLVKLNGLKPEVNDGGTAVITVKLEHGLTTFEFSKETKELVNMHIQTDILDAVLLSNGKKLFACTNDDTICYMDNLSTLLNSPIETLALCQNADKLFPPQEKENSEGYLKPCVMGRLISSGDEEVYNCYTCSTCGGVIKTINKIYDKFRVTKQYLYHDIELVGIGLDKTE